MRCQWNRVMSLLSLFVIAVLWFVLFIAMAGWVSSIKESAKKMERMMEQQDRYLCSISANLAQLINLGRPLGEPTETPTKE